MTRRTLLLATLPALALRWPRPSPSAYRDTFHHVRGYERLVLDPAMGSGAWLAIVGNPPYTKEPTLCSTGNVTVPTP